MPSSWAGWYIHIIPALRRLRQEGHEFKTSLGYTARPSKAWGLDSSGRAHAQQAQDPKFKPQFHQKK
jgi:hypothetical protein